MNDKQQCQTLLNQWQQDYQQLLDILNSEQSALEKRDFPALELATNDKTRQVNTINRHQIPESINRQVNIRTLGELKRHCESSSTLSSGWKKLMRLVAKCSFQNEVNARLVDLLSSSCRRTFNLIKGFDPDNNLYNASGGRTSVKYKSQSLSA